MSRRGTQVWGSVALHPEPIVIKGTNNTLNFQVDGVEYEASIPQGTYATRLELFTSELLEPVNEALRSAQAPVIARLGGNRQDKHICVLVFEHTDTSDDHVIDSFGGSSRDVIWGETEHISAVQ
ncbi:hypothetical protein [Paenibacillus thiaminolyticus]|uniref:Uncharacterized protein n=1 Tax=Paenibacillus thiaminolyticus TaxID=49283 RepID=A0A3A3GD05_PANTH|nr:hypothetical protein [Paenibacillus thiaminolyticus]RJG21646.1 hypothetical protein DQX05_20715 [Paenibacillus thiaminolyticus]